MYVNRRVRAQRHTRVTTWSNARVTRAVTQNAVSAVGGPNNAHGGPHGQNKRVAHSAACV